MKGYFVFFLLFPTLLVAETTRIATWNLGGFHQISQVKLDNITKGMKKLDADIIVLPELNPLSHGQVLADKLSEPNDSCYKAVVPDQPKARQEIGILYKCHVTVINPGLVIGSDLGKQGYRNAAVAHVKIEDFDFVLVGFHLKAGRGTSNRSLRNNQLKIINGFIQGVLMAGEKDVIVIGDYNMIPGQDVDNFNTLNADGSLRFVSSEDLTGQGSHISTHGIGNLLDGYAFTTVDDPEYQNGSLKIVQMHDELGLSLQDFKKQVTDHLPLVAVFETGVDRD